MPIPFQQLVNKTLREKNESREKKEQETWYASGLGSCLRGMYLSRLGLKPDQELTDRELRVFDVGNQMEDWLVGLLKQQKDIEVETQVRVESKEHHISGKCDALVLYAGEKEVKEIKTKHSKAFWYMTKEGKPMRQHEQQLWVYLWLLNVDKGTIVYLSKDDLAIAEFPVRRDDKKLEAEVMSQLNALNEAWDKKNPLLLDLPAEDSWQAKYCKHHKKCVDEKYLKQLKIK